MSNTFKDNTGISVDGHVLIKDADSGEVLLDKHNAINFENFALAVARLLGGLANVDNNLSYKINRMAFGRDGTIIDAVGNITYRTPDVFRPDGTLYDTDPYIKQITTLDDGINFDPDNFSEVIAYADEPFADTVITATLDYDEPSAQLEIDNATNTDNSNYIFDEIGLITEEGSYLTHLIFHPIQKSANRRIQVVYTIRIRAGQ